MTTYVLPLNPTEVRSDFDALGAALTWTAEHVNVDFGFFPPGQPSFGSALNGIFGSILMKKSLITTYGANL